MEGLFEIPEVRSVTPGHLVRCGHTTVYDVNFGKEVGASAVLLLNKGITGVTVIGVNRGKIQYQETAKVIEQRFVDTSMISFYEDLGVCFGRKPEELSVDIEEHKGPIDRIL